MPRLPALSLIALASALALLAGCAPAAAEPLVRLDVVDRAHGHWLAGYPHRRETWIAGIPGHHYGVRLTNTSGERVLVVLSVDGINAVTGESAHPSQPGYVLAPWQSTEITGWRKSHADVAQFVFTDLPDSYAARTGRPRDIGTIGIAVFRERFAMPAPVGPPVSRAEALAKPAPSAADSARGHPQGEAYVRQGTGTGHGVREWSPAGETWFQRASRHPVQLTQLRYDTPDALAARGIVPRPLATWSSDDAPHAFPGFVADPPPGAWP